MDEDIRQLLESQRVSEAFEMLVDRYQNKVFGLAFGLLRNEAQAQDAAQDVFVKIWRGLPGFKGGASLSTWIYAITRNTCLTEIKKRAVRSAVSIQDPEFEGALDRDSALQTRDADSGSEIDVNTLLGQLPEKYRQVITLFYLEQKAYEEVATLLGIPLGTVKTLLFRARKELLRLSAREPVSVPDHAGVRMSSDVSAMRLAKRLAPAIEPLKS